MVFVVGVVPFVVQPEQCVSPVMRSVSTDVSLNAIQTVDLDQVPLGIDRERLNPRVINRRDVEVKAQVDLLAAARSDVARAAAQYPRSQVASDLARCRKAEGADQRHPFVFQTLRSDS